MYPSIVVDMSNIHPYTIPDVLLRRLGSPGGFAVQRVDLFGLDVRIPKAF